MGVAETSGGEAKPCGRQPSSAQKREMLQRYRLKMAEKIKKVLSASASAPVYTDAYASDVLQRRLHTDEQTEGYFRTREPSPFAAGAKAAKDAKDDKAANDAGAELALHVVGYRDDSGEPCAAYAEALEAARAVGGLRVEGELMGRSAYVKEWLPRARERFGVDHATSPFVWLSMGADGSEEYVGGRDEFFEILS